MNVTVRVLTKNLRHPIYLAQYAPSLDESKEKIWFGYVEEKKNKKTKKLTQIIFYKGRKPTRCAGSGRNRQDSIDKLMGWVTAAYMNWDLYCELIFHNPDVPSCIKETCNKK